MLTSRLSFLFLVVLMLSHCSKTLADQSSPVPSPSPTPSAKHKPSSSSPPPPPLPTDTVAVLLEARNYTTFAQLIKATHVDNQLFTQLNTSTDGVTIFAPTDSAFSTLGKATVESLNDMEKVELVQFHMLPRLLATIPDFQTLSNAVKTMAGSNARFSFTITTTDSEVTISTGVVKARIAGTVYNDTQVAVYEVDKVLQPKNFFPPAPAPEPAGSALDSPVVPNDASASLRFGVPYGVLVAYRVGFLATLLVAL